MAEIKADTTKMREYGNDVLKLTDEYLNLVNDLFIRLSYIPTKTKERIGIGAENFISNITQYDKHQLVQLGDTLEKYGKFLIQNADYLENFANKNKV